MRAAIMGLGQIAWRYDRGLPQDGVALTHLSALRLAGIEVIGGADPSAAARDEFTRATGKRAFVGHVALLDQSPDIVTIASPTAMHAEHLAACLDAGVRHIWLEKPATTDAVQTATLAARADALGARVLVGFQRRYMPVYRALGDNGRGRLEGIEITYSRGLETNGAHMVDQALWLLGDERPEVIGVMPGAAPRHVSEPCPSFLLQGANGIPVSVIGLDLSYHSIDITAHYAEGRCSVRWGGQLVQHEVKIPNPLYEGFFCLGPETPDQPLQDTRLELAGVLPALLTDLLHGKDSQPRSNLHSAGLGQAVIAEVLTRCA